MEPALSLKTTLIFDFDGTIADSLHRLLEISNSFAEEYGYLQVSKEDIPRFREKTAMEAFRELKVPLLKVPLIVRRVRKAFRQEAHLACPYSDMQAVLPGLSRRYRLGILTSNSALNVRSFLRQHQLEYFDFIYTSGRLLGKSRVLHRIMKEKNLLANEIMFVGDEIRDVEAARKAGIEVIAVSWGANTKKALLSAGPTYLIQNAAELNQLLL
ncbi:MAG: HAD-IA family hydrolase [Cyclobacteriaceae bacterium]